MNLRKHYPYAGNSSKTHYVFIPEYYRKDHPQFDKCYKFDSIMNAKIWLRANIPDWKDHAMIRIS